MMNNNLYVNVCNFCGSKNVSLIAGARGFVCITCINKIITSYTQRKFEEHGKQNDSDQDLSCDMCGDLQGSRVAIPLFTTGSFSICLECSIWAHDYNADRLSELIKLDRAHAESRNIYHFHP